MSESNLYKKITTAKSRLHSAKLKKSGENKFSQYDYFELADFLPKIIELENELNFCCNISFGLELATLTIIDVDNPLQIIEITSPMSSANLKGMNDVQNLGAVQTYLRRYLYMAAFEIVEHDAIDGAKEQPKEPAKAEKLPLPAKNLDDKIDQNMVNAIIALAMNEKNELDPIKTAMLKDVNKSHGYTKTSEIKRKDFDTIKAEVTKAIDDFNNTKLPFEGV